LGGKIPRVLRGLFQRERRLLGLLARAARDAIVPSVRAILDRHDVTPGLVVSIQTFGSYAANFHPHVHALLTDGAFTEEGEFLQLPYFDARLVEEVFHRRLLQRLHRAERLSEEFQRSLLGWVHSGFSVHGEQTVPTDDLKGAERLARYLTRGPLPIDVVEKVEGGRLSVRTPPDPRTGLVEKILDPLDLIHALTTQIPDPGRRHGYSVRLAHRRVRIDVPREVCPRDGVLTLGDASPRRDRAPARTSGRPTGVRRLDEPGNRARLLPASRESEIAPAAPGRPRSWVAAMKAPILQSFTNCNGARVAERRSGGARIPCRSVLRGCFYEMDDARYVCVRMARRPASMGPRIVGRRRHARGQRAHLRALRRRHPPRIRQCFRGCASERARLESEPSEVLIPLTSFVSVRDRKKQENLVDKNYPLHPETVSGTSKQNSRVDSPATEPCEERG
jgi:hypothetical protein